MAGLTVASCDSIILAQIHRICLLYAMTYFVTMVTLSEIREVLDNFDIAH